MAISYQTTGLQELQNWFKGTSVKVQLRGVKKGIDAASKRLVAEMRKRIPVRTGLAKKALGKRVKKYASSTVAVVGIRHGFRVKVTRRELKRLIVEGAVAVVRRKDGTVRVFQKAKIAKPIKLKLARVKSGDYLNPSYYGHLILRKVHFINQALAASKAAALVDIQRGVTGEFTK